MEHIPVAPPRIAVMDGLGDWRYLLGAIHAQYKAGSFPAAAAMVVAIAEAAEAADHHPDVDVRYPDVVRVALRTHATGGVTMRDVELARTITNIALHADAISQPLVAQAVEVAIDTMDADRIRPFWKAVLGYKEVDGALVDPQRAGPPFWFQQMTEPRTERSRFHIDITVPHEIAEDRVADAIAAGGRLVTAEFARSWWVLADADGNEACICTWQDR